MKDVIRHPWMTGDTASYEEFKGRFGNLLDAKIYKNQQIGKKNVDWSPQKFKIDKIQNRGANTTFPDNF